MFDITPMLKQSFSAFSTVRNTILSRDKKIDIASKIIYEEHNKGLSPRDIEKGGRDKLGAEVLAERMINYFEGGGSPRTEVERKVYDKIK